MPLPALRFAVHAASLDGALDAIRSDLGITAGFPDDVVAEAEQVARSGPQIVTENDLRDIPFVTIDPPRSRDLDQALAIKRSPTGYVVHYAIADVGAFVLPGSALDREARSRGVTVYLPDRRAPLHPPVLSEGAASLLPGSERQALVWRFELDADADVVGCDVRRAIVQSRRAYSYDEVQAQIDAGTADGTLTLFEEVGRRRQDLEHARGGVALRTPDQVVVSAAGRYELVYRAPLPAEGWNAQISLMTGMAAAGLMLDAGVAILRTLPRPSDDDVAVLRRHAQALGVAWPSAAPYGEFIRGLDPAVPDHAALLAQAARLFRGAGYAAFDVADASTAPPERTHAAVAAPYAHVTAPLRRLVDRFGNEIVLAACAGEDVPDWVRAALPQLPELMAEARRRESAADGQVNDLIEAAVLAGRVGSVLDAVVVRQTGKGVQVQVRHPAVVAVVDGSGLELGDEVRVRVVAADPAKRRVDLALVP